MAYDLVLKAGTTSKIIQVMLRDSTTGQGKTAVAHSAVTGSYCREGATRQPITMASGTAGDAFSSGKWCEVDSTNMPGIYQFHIPDAAITTGVRAVKIFLKATDVLDKEIDIGLVSVDVADSVRAGLTALPNAAADGAGGLPISDAGGLDLDNRMPAAAAITNMNTVFNTDFAANYDATNDKWKVNLTFWNGTDLSTVGFYPGVNVEQLDQQTVVAFATVNIGAYVGNATAYLVVDGSGYVTYNNTAPPSAATIADAVWDEAQSGHTSPGTFGYFVDSQISAAGGGSLTAADVWSYATRVLTAGTNIALAKGTGVTGFNDIAAADVWAVGTRTITGGTITTYTGNTPQTGDAYAIVNSGTYGNAALKTLIDSIGATAIRSNTAQSGSTSTTIKLDASASATNNLYRGTLILTTGGTGAGQARTITAYNGTTKIATVDRAWATTPDNTTTFSILAADNPALNATLQVSAASAQAVIRSGTAQSGSTTNTIKLDSGASATNSIYVGNLVTITGGTGLGQSRSITAYVGSTKVATVDRNWAVTPDNTSTFAIYANLTPSTFSDQGVAQAATGTTLTLASTASATNDIYNGSMLLILSGTGSGQSEEITDYDGTTKVATVASWGVTPDSTSAYAVIPTRGLDVPSIPPTVAEIWGHTSRQLSSDGLDLILCADSTTLWKNACVHGAVVLMGVTAGAGTTSETFTKYGYVVTSTNDGVNRTATSVA